jgi:hypothetical protein
MPATLDWCRRWHTTQGGQQHLQTGLPRQPARLGYAITPGSTDPERNAGDQIRGQPGGFAGDSQEMDSESKVRYMTETASSKFVRLANITEGGRACNVECVKVS